MRWKHNTEAEAREKRDRRVNWQEDFNLRKMARAQLRVCELSLLIVSDGPARAHFKADRARLRKILRLH